MVVIKRFLACPPDADWLQLVAELEFASQLNHENVVRTFGIGLEAGRYFAISEYLEGATLEALLHSCAAAQTQLPHAAVVRILLSILDAVNHADLIAASGPSNPAGAPIAAGPLNAGPLNAGPITAGHALARASIAVDDVFITSDGQVKLLGFKSTHARTGLTKTPAIDALLEQQLTRELRRALLSISAPRLVRAANDGANDPADEIRRALRGGPAALGDGRAELALAMRQVLRNERALQALRLAREFARLRGPVRRPPPLSSEEEMAPASGYRRIGPRESNTTAPFGLVRPRHS